MTFSGAVLTGGSSRRMGQDKALLEVGGRPLAVAAASALASAGASDVVCVGGALDALTAQGLTAIPDRYPGEGPLGGLITALDHAGEDVVMVLSCDLPGSSAEAVTTTVRALEAAPWAELAVPVHDDRRHWLHAAYRRATLAHWEAAFAAGERSLHRPAGYLIAVEVAGLAAAWLDDADEPGDLPGETG